MSYDIKSKQEKKRSSDQSQNENKGEKGKVEYPSCCKCGKKHPRAFLKGMRVYYNSGEKATKLMISRRIKWMSLLNETIIENRCIMKLNVLSAKVK